MANIICRQLGDWDHIEYWTEFTFQVEYKGSAASSRINRAKAARRSSKATRSHSQCSNNNNNNNNNNNTIYKAP